MFQVNQRDGRRWSAADAFLRPALKRPNLEVMTRTRVLRVEFEGDRAVGVRIASGRGRERSIRAEREVILSAGAIQSPQLLLLSGIGSADDLRAIGVEARHDLPGVGRNLQDHPFVTLIWEVSDQNTLYGADKPKPLAEWVLRRTGPLTSSVAEVVAFVRTRPGLPAADVQFHMGAAYYEDHGAETYDGHCAVIAPVLVSPQARGRVWLRSADPTAKPRMITNSLSEPDDVRSLVDGMELAREIATQGPMREIIVSELKPGPRPARPHRSRSRPAPAPDADLSPGRHVPDERRGRRRGGRLPASRPRTREPARRRRVGHARHPRREHQRPDDHDRRARGGPDPVRRLTESGRQTTPKPRSLNAMARRRLRSGGQLVARV